VFDYHSAYVWKKKDGSATGCALYAVFPATPLFAIPGIEERELKSDPRLDNFILSYRKYLKLNPNQFRTFVIRGRLKVTKNYKGRGRGKIGFGQNAGFRSAIIIEQISDSIPGAKL
jgi:hypothetical protein